jgi:hypothetical protein
MIEKARVAFGAASVGFPADKKSFAPTVLDRMKRTIAEPETG